MCYREDFDSVMNVRVRPMEVCQGPLVKETEGHIPQLR